MRAIKKIGAAIALVLFCCISLYAKEGYKITLQIKDSTGTPFSDKSNGYKTATLSLLNWNGNTLIDSVSISPKGYFVFVGKKSLEPGEYAIKWNGTPVELFISNKEYTKENLQITNGIIKHLQGSHENGHFTRFQNLINHGWKKLNNTAQLVEIIDSTAGVLKSELPNSLFTLMLHGYTNQDNDSVYKYFKDTRIKNTKFGKKLLTDFFTSIEYNSNDTVISRIERLIESASDSLKPSIATEAFRYFCKPKIMGQESVACHIAENYFMNKKLPADKSAIFEMNTFVMLNKNSLLGMQAQELRMQDTLGVYQSLHELESLGEYTIILFYTDDCRTCKTETPRLVDFVNEYSMGVINVYAIYTQDSKERWKKYIDENFYLYNPFVNWVNVWDPDVESGFHLLYNVISTPQIYLTDKNGTIIGRGLNTESLKELIQRMKEEQASIRKFLDSYLGKYGNTNDTAAIKESIDLLYEKSKKDKSVFKDIFAELYYYLKNSQSVVMKEFAVYVADRYIAKEPQLWDGSVFAEKILKEFDGLKKNMPGEIAADLNLKDLNDNTINIYSIPGKFKILYFYNTGCSLCDPITEELSKLYAEYSGKNGETAFIAINTGTDKDEWKKFVHEKGDKGWINLSGHENVMEIYGKYYWEELPCIYLLDKENRVIVRNVSPWGLKNIIEPL